MKLCKCNHAFTGKKMGSAFLINGQCVFFKLHFRKCNKIILKMCIYCIFKPVLHGLIIDMLSCGSFWNVAIKAAWWCCEFCNLAYGKLINIKQILLKLGIKKYIFITKKQDIMMHCVFHVQRFSSTLGWIPWTL